MWKYWSGIDLHIILQSETLLFKFDIENIGYDIEQSGVKK